MFRNYADSDLFVVYTRRKNLTSDHAVGGGVNGNSIGLVAAMTVLILSKFPPLQCTSMMLPSAKKAFSGEEWVFIEEYSRCLLFASPCVCVSEMILTISSPMLTLRLVRLQRL